MFTPSTVPYATQFYPIGNTPAVSLTRGLPQGIDADILLLGCGDVRNILFTTYTEKGFPPRKLDITCCDIEPGIIARNVLLFTLLIDGIDSDRAWDIYFHLRINESSEKLIKDQALKIVSLSDSINQWNEGQYGSTLKFCDAHSLQRVRQVWKKYASSQPNSEARFEEEIGRSRSLTRTLSGLSEGDSETVLTALRSVAPLLMASNEGILEARGYFWKHGNFSRQPGTIPNPTYSVTMSANTYLHYGTDPILGFHLATALANLAPTSPLRPNKDDDEIFQAVEAAKTQFYEWVAAFQEISQNNLVLRFAVSDALSFSHGLRVISTSRSGSACLFRRQLDPTPVEFDPVSYATVNSAPTKFDVIDTSNLADHFGGLNVLVATAPLLKASASSTLWMETLLKTEKTRKRQFDALLRGHAPTISLLLGLAPVDYWTNATSVSYIDELLINFVNSPSTKMQQTLSRLAWKLDTVFSQQPNYAMVLDIDSRTLAATIFEVYKQMFENEDPMSFMNSDPKETLERLQANTYTRYHRGSFATLVKHIQANTSTDWPSFWSQLLQLIDQDSQDKRTLRNLYRQELGVQLHLHGLYTEKWLKEGVSPQAMWSGFNAWKHIPEVVCVTVAVPKQRIDHLYSTEASKINAPTLEGILASDSSLGWQNLFSGVHVTFGDVEPSGSRDAEGFSITVRENPLGWKGNSPLVASFYVPSGALQVEPRVAKVGLSIQNTPLNMKAFTHLQPSMEVFTTTLGDESKVFVTRYEPGMLDYPSTINPTYPTAKDNITHSNAPATTKMTANFEGNKIISLCGHTDFSSSQQGKELLEERASIELRQSSPSCIDIVFGKEALIHPVSFPAPVLKETAKTRIARTSGYVEVIAPLANPLTSEPLSAYIYPSMLGDGSVPIALNSQHVNLDSLPILDVDESHKRENRWLNILASHQFSVGERELRKSQTESPSLRMNFKESLFTMFMLSSGLQGGNTGLFALQHPEDGNQILIFIRAIRINGAEGSVVADAAVVPFTTEMVLSKELETFLYVLRELEMCAITVNDEELALWKKVLPVFAERCRTWSHGPHCEYKKSGATIPLSMQMGKQFMCSCGNGKLPEHFMSLPDWEEKVVKHAVRVAISPTFSVPLVEDVVDFDMLNAHGGMKDLYMDRCRSCGAMEKTNGGSLLKCARCKNVSYCSAECQRKDWKKHRAECKPSDAA